VQFGGLTGLRVLPTVEGMKRRWMGIAMASMMLACAKGSTSPQHYVGTIGSGSATAPDPDDGDDGDGEDEDEGEATSTSDGVDDPFAESSDDGAPAESSGAAESSGVAESSGDDGVAESSEDDGAPAPPSDAWDACDASACEEGSDCVGVDGLRGFSDFCSPQCETADDCFPPATGDAVPVCAIDVGGAGESTHCALVCEVDGDPFGECPNGMFCIDLPGQPTPVSICMWV
jgi:hypothetical protein